jgi:photosynthetic reaction center H subunit
MPIVILEQYDLAIILFWAFTAFFAGLIYYLHGESKREGYPLVTDRLSDRVKVVGFPAMPAAKTFLRAGGGSVSVPMADGRADTRALALRQVARFFGAPYEPTGNPLADGVGPASYAERADVPDIGMDGKPILIPLSKLPEFHLETRDPDPRGMEVVGADRMPAGTVSDIWVDRADSVVRYFEIAAGEGMARRILVPLNFCRIDGGKRRITVKALLGEQIAAAPGPRAPDQVTKLEEDKILGYFGGGWLYATPERAEPLL